MSIYECDFVEHSFITLLVVGCFIALKFSYDSLRHWRAKINVIVIGAGPIGLTSVIIASENDKVDRITLYEEKTRSELFARPQQIAFDPRSVDFLRGYGVDFDNIEGCWYKEHFYTRIGVFLEYMLSRIRRLKKDTNVYLGKKFSCKYQDCLSDTENKLRTVYIVCDGSTGRTSRFLSLNEDFLEESCKAYGAVATIERCDQQQIPTPDIRIHSLQIDLSAYGNEFAINRPIKFHLKIFGTFRNRYMALCCPKTDAHFVKMLRSTSDQLLMRNVFQQSYNSYKMPSEPSIKDKSARSLKCSRRLYEIKLSYRRESVVYIEDEDVVVTAEGDAARYLNFNSGMDVNLGFRGLESIDAFLREVTLSDCKLQLTEALEKKLRHAHLISVDFVQRGIQSTMFS